jgi:glycosyltransferase involved in cell wall biosynthesis
MVAIAVHDAVMVLPPDTPIEVDEHPPRRRSLRLAVVTETYPPEVNGVAATIASFVAGLHARDHEVQLVRPRQRRLETASDAERFQEVLLGGLPIPNYPHLKMGMPSKRALVALWKLRRPDLVHVVTEGPLGWSAIQAASTLRLPVVSDFRTNFHSYSRHYGMGWLQRPILAYLRKFHNRTRLTMVPTEALRRQLAESGFENLKVVARGVDTARFSPQRRSESLRRRWGVPAGSTVMLHVGRLAPEKNLAALVQSYDALQSRHPDTVLVLVGDGPSRAELERRCPRAVFAGMRTGDDLAEHYASGDVFLFPSTTETFGNVTAEAMASGLAVVAYDYAAAGQLIEPGISGILVPFDDTAAFVRAAVAVAGDMAAIARMGRHARHVAEGHSWVKIVEQLESMFLQVLSAPPAVRSHRANRARTALARTLDS